MCTQTWVYVQCIIAITHGNKRTNTNTCTSYINDKYRFIYDQWKKIIKIFAYCAPLVSFPSVTSTHTWMKYKYHTHIIIIALTWLHSHTYMYWEVKVYLKPQLWYNRWLQWVEWAPGVSISAHISPTGQWTHSTTHTQFILYMYMWYTLYLGVNILLAMLCVLTFSDLEIA